MKRLRSVAFVPLLFAACESLPRGAITSSPGAEPAQLGLSLEGDWTGAAEILRFDASLTQADTRLTGSGAVGPTEESGADFPTLTMDIVGSYSHPVVELTWRPASGGWAYSFTGQLVTPIRIEGIVTVGERAVPLILHRPEAAPASSEVSSSR